MLRKVWFGLVFGLVAMMLVGVAINGCGTVTKTITAAVDTVTTIGSSEVTISGTLVYSDGKIDINLNPVVPGTGDAITIIPTNVRVRVGTDPATITSAATLTVTVPAASSKPIDIAFILDNTGSMSGAITGSKNSISAFAQTLEAAGIDAKFGLVTFGDSPKHPTPPGLISDEGSPDYYDASFTREVMALGTASDLQTKLGIVNADGGGDTPENPLDAIKWAYNNMAWRAGAQKIFIVITDVEGHQITDGTLPSSSGGNRCTTSAEAVIASLFGKAVIYSVSPNFTSSLGGLLDARRLADGLGEGRITAESNTGGKWIEFQSSGFDLTGLGIATTLTKSYTLKFSYTLDAGTYYILIEIDTDGDGVFDSNMLIKIGVSSSSAKALTAFSNAVPKPVSAAGSKPIYVAPPNN